ncbi:MAG: hypothetical protein BA872_00475 [Desulfobacterales bacterium C00003060]|nr:MAG: hypothetical protein BA861_01310 [Desulfobacterales bacterium S3730MH5]OEU80229.1 MAG: hypothetical protein BA872_00475 [Desulfobacterales bacterium C00003060]
MASNFTISVHRNSDQLDLRLMGDFDGTSACELLNALEKNGDSVGKVFIHTSGLKRIFPFGRDTFQNNLYVLKNRPMRLIFTGKNSAEIAPEPGKLRRILRMP